MQGQAGKAGIGVKKKPKAKDTKLDPQPWIKLPAVGYGSPTTTRFGFSIQWKNNRLYLGDEEPITTAVAILLTRLTENENLLGWVSEKAMKEDIQKACNLLKSLETRNNEDEEKTQT